MIDKTKESSAINFPCPYINLKGLKCGALTGDACRFIDKFGNWEVKYDLFHRERIELAKQETFTC